jgi:hypothetical protein
MRSSLAGVAAMAIAAAGCNAILAPTPTDANWRTVTTAHYSFYVRPDSFAEANIQKIGEVLEDQFATTSTRLGLRYDGRITMFLHNSGADAGFGGDQGGGDHTGVAYPETETVKTVAVPPLDGGLFSLLSHEANHVIIRNGLGRPGTSFVNEGLASALVSETFSSFGAAYHHDWLAQRRSQIPRLSALVNDDKWQGYPQQMKYAAAASFLAFAADVYGLAPLKAIYYASGDFEAVFTAAYGKTLDQVEAEWLAFISASASR